MKPVTSEKVKKALETLRYGSAFEEGRVKAVTFGNFEVYFKGEPIKFKYKKTKELLAYLIDRRGALCANNDIIAVIWEDDDFGMDRQDYLKKLKQDLSKTFSELGVEDIIIKQRGQIGINPKKIECDYFKYLEGDSTIMNSYQGEYMAQYGWSEYAIFKNK
jgi:two-component SAPR family response regulator